MKYSSKDVVLLIDGYNVLGEMTELTHAAEALTEEVTGLGDDWEEHEYIGVQRAEISQSGYFDDASLSVNDAFNGKQGDKRVVCFGVEGNTAGKAFVGLNGALETRFERIASVKGLHKANIAYVVSGKSEDGIILLPLSTKTADGDTESASIDNSAESTGGADLYLQVTALELDGADDLTVKVRSSADGVTWADLDTFTAVTSAPAAEMKIKTGTIPQYLAVSWAFTGTSTAPSATIMVGAVRL
jgi:hypothetical protein